MDAVEFYIIESIVFENSAQAVEILAGLVADMRRKTPIRRCFSIVTSYRLQAKIFENKGEWESASNFYQLVLDNYPAKNPKAGTLDYLDIMNIKNRLHYCRHMESVE